MAAAHEGGGDVFEQRVQRNMEAFGRRDLAAVMRWWADDGILELAGHTPISGRYEGKDAIAGFFRSVFERYASARLTVRHVAFTNPVALTYRNTVYVESELEATSADGVTIHDERIAVFEYRRGKVVSMREWAFDPTIIEAIWGHEARPATA
jgi:ketosteroid isomerase-like protein